MLEKTIGNGQQRIAIYLTDGYGEFPSAPPAYPVLWVVAPGGLMDEEFPLGLVTRIRNG
jgi:predicted metal-dependent peptidase